MITAEKIIEMLKLQPHPKEGGFFRETYRSTDILSDLPARYRGQRSASTAIYYLLTPTSFSAVHRVTSDEGFHFYLGSPVQMLQLFPDMQGKIGTLGSDLRAGQSPQVIVPAGVWQGSKLAPGGDFALLGNTVAPGFEYADYESGEREKLIQQYPEFAKMIRELTPIS
jgi:predicted cupin superfamily sugar epimerase